MAKKREPGERFYLNAERLRVNGACEGAIEDIERALGPGNWSLTDENYQRLKATDNGSRIQWIATRYLSHREYYRALRDHYIYDALWAAIKRKMARDHKPRPRSWR